MQSAAIYVDANGQVVVQDFAGPGTVPGEIFIQVLYSGINPSDMRATEFFGHRQRRLGNEFCGRVIESPSLADAPFEAGDIVAGCVDGSQNRPGRSGAHQSYISVPPKGLWKVPSHVPYPHAATLTVSTQTAIDALYNRLRLPFPGSVGTPTNGTLVIWGGATSVGIAAIQLARASGITSIVATASAIRHDYLATLGATHCVDYNDPNAVEQVRMLLEESKSSPIFGFDAIGTVNSQKLLASATWGRHDVCLVTVLVVPDRGFEAALGSRHIDSRFTLPNGEALVFPAHPDEAKMMQKVLVWVIDHYGRDFKALPVRVLDGTVEEVLREIATIGKMKAFGKAAIKHPLSR